MYVYIFDKDQFCVYRVSRKKYQAKLHELDFINSANTCDSDEIANKLTDWVRQNGVVSIDIEDIIKTH